MRRFTLHALFAAIVIALMGMCLAQPADAARKRSKKARISSKSKKKRSKIKVRNRRKGSSYSRRARPVQPLIIRGTDTILSPHEPFVTFSRPVEITNGMEGDVIAIWPSHGLYFNPASNRWQYQRPKLFTTLEDLFSQTFVSSYIAPMLENAGAYVMMPRERDKSPYEVIADYDGMPQGEYAVVTGSEKWEELEDSTGYAWKEKALTHNDNPFVAGTADVIATVSPKHADKASTAQWNVSMPERGKYAVYVSYASLPNSATDAQYTVNHLGGSAKVKVNQQMGGGTWIYLGTYELDKGAQAKPVVELSNVSSDKGSVVSADAVKVGGGMGSVSRSAYSDDVTSGVPKFNEGASTYLQTAGFPRYVWEFNKGESAYKDDYMSRAHWANYLAGGSEMFPDTTGLCIPVDMAFAFHTDAGRTTDGSTVGTLGLYSTDDGNPFGNGSARSANADLARSVQTSVVDDIRRTYDPQWNSRSYYDKKYYEIRETKMPAMILEALSHQNFEDMRRGLDPEFRFILSRAVYKGILKFMARRYGREYAVQPLPVKEAALKYMSPGKYRLSWAPAEDILEPSAFPTYYIVEERTDDGGFSPVATVSKPEYDIAVSDDEIHSYRVIAGNDGGVSFPSEVLALYDRKNLAPEVLIVNGFTRTAAPGIAAQGNGFDIQRTPAVADGADVGTCGAQYEFTEEASNLGASYGNLDGATFAGNTRDFVAEHGRMIRKAGRSFISTSADAFAASEPSPYDPKVIDLILGLQKTDIRPGSNEIRHEAFPAPLRERLIAHSRRGGALLATGSYVVTDLLATPADSIPVDRDKAWFAREILGVTSGSNEECIGERVAMIPGRIPGFYANNFDFKTKPDASHYAATEPDALTPVKEEDVVMRYYDCGLPAAVVSEIDPGNGAAVSRTLVMGFPLETVTDPLQQEVLMRAALKYLTTKK